MSKRGTKLVLNYVLLMAAARDAGNSNMKKHGRTKWNTEDLDVACAKQDELAKYLDDPSHPFPN